jgi:hypothetical protein
MSAAGGLDARETKLALAADNPYGPPSHEAQITAATDPRGRHIDYLNSLADHAEIYVGEIVDGVARANAYRVQLERLGSTEVCTEISGLSYTASGPTEIKSYVPGTRVLVYRNPRLEHGLILGAIPRPALSGSIHDHIALTSRDRVDEAEKRYLNMSGSGQIANYSSWRPYDGLQAGEWGAISTTGLKVTVDDFLVQCAVNEFTGVFGFYHDQLLRVSGYNMQTWTAGYERESYMDQAEYNDTQGYTPYPWEATGSLLPGQNLIKEYDHASFGLAGGRPYYSHWENKYDNLQPFHRTLQFYGYYGQGGKTALIAPPNDAQWWVYELEKEKDPEKPYESSIKTNEYPPTTTAKPGDAKETLSFQNDKPPIGLAEDNTSLDGRRFIASAKGITIAKRMLLPVPTRMRRPEDGTGDNETNYKFAGYDGAGNGEKHHITGDMETDAKNANLQRAAGILDLHGYLFNYVGLHPFHWHAKDYKTWEQSELKYAEYNHALPKYSDLKSSMYLPEPDFKKLDIDHRYKQQKFYQSEAFLSILEDGSVVIGDGYGAEIRMCAGSITISAPGDVWLKPGKNAQVWAGRDIIHRANGAVDISTTEKSIRIKAEKDVFVLAGNDENKPGGVLIESRSQVKSVDFEPQDGQPVGDGAKFGGILLRAPGANIATQTQNLYLRAGVEGEGGSIVLDAGKGEDDIITVSNKIRHYVGENGEIAHFFSRAEIDSPQAGNIFTGKENFFTGNTFVAGDVYASGGLMAPDFVYSYGNITGKNFFVAPCEKDCYKQLSEAANKIDQYAKDKLPTFARGDYATKVETPWYNEKRAGNDRVIAISSFSFRADSDYRVEEDFELFEDRWQQYARIGGENTGTWQEKPVKDGAGQETWPFPGKAMFDANIFMQQDFTILETVSGGFRDKDRGSGGGSINEAYMYPKFKSVSGGKSLKDGYMIIK